ncbi:tetratricopeptide repeat domain 4 [Tieghemostelium lacteum]|uniref:Tetratricopeptide repeat domain 4 n=1 Tax=Tieghemostelium lacteum TaxID=361077 RepID=A0A151Z5N0_TIELA|nr:tetratricopeptide repeat domain 4 [Tieghemostelium lacteum]|eukprot:KYQ89248.1 tetratricopeptide repeat domain 4 [Tieghemostelium lacteum]
MSTFNEPTLTEEEEDQLWANSVELWKKQKEERKRDREEKIKQGIPVPTEEEEDNEWKNLPIFMTSMPDNPENNPNLSAIQAIIDETTPEERSDTYKDLGNDYFKAGKSRYKEALHYYNQALNVKCNDMKRNSIVLSNRAAVNLELGNNGEVIRDCKIAIEFNRQNIKAYFRLMRALIALHRDQEALVIGDQFLKEIDPNNVDIQKLRDQSQKKIELVQKKELEKQQKESTKKAQLDQLANELWTKKQYRLGEPFMDLSSYTYQSDRKITIDSTGLTHFPVLFLYPEYNQSDFIMDFQEGQTCGDHLDMMFPPENPEFPPWDRNKSYQIQNLEIYFETNWTKPLLNTIKPVSEQKRWIRVKHTTPIETILSHKEYVIPSIPIFYVLDKTSKFYSIFLTKK